MGINVTGINHVIVAVEDLDAGIETFGTTWGLSLDHLGEAPELGIKAAYFNVGDAVLELVTPYDDSESNFVRKHIERRGEGLYMFCVRVDDMAAAIADLRAKGCAPSPTPSATTKCKRRSSVPATRTASACNCCSA